MAKDLLKRCEGSHPYWTCWAREPERGKELGFEGCHVCQGREVVLTEKGERIKELLLFLGVILPEREEKQNN